MSHTYLRHKWHVELFLPVIAILGVIATPVPSQADEATGIFADHGKNTISISGLIGQNNILLAPVDDLEPLVMQGDLAQSLQLRDAGTANSLSVIQKGRGNGVVVTGQGTGNTVGILQSGHHNFAQIAQSGVMNSVSIVQGAW